MSLFIGNLSERTRRDELEHVFRRFGHCNLQLKREGYGFVVFDFPSDADKALRALKGRNICGEPLNLTWSNKQPRHFERFGRDGRTCELQPVRNSDRLGYARRKVNFNGWRNYKMGNVRRGKSVHMPSEEKGYHQDGFEDYDGEEKDYGGDFTDDGGGVIPNLEDNGRWGDSICDPSIDNGNENSIEFDRYEPYHGHDRKHENENHHIGFDSPVANSQENVGTGQIDKGTSNHPNDSKYQQTCYRCGDSGHRMRNCPKEHSSPRKYSRFDVGQDDKIDRKHKVEDDNKFGSSSWVKLGSSGDTSSMRHRRNDRRGSGSQHYHLSLRNESSPAAKETNGHRRMDYGGNKQSRKEIKSPKRYRVKKPRRSISSSTRSSSHSRSRSRSLSSKARSSSLNLSSFSKSQYFRGRSPNSMRSSSPRSLSVSLSQPLPSSPIKIQLNPKSPFIDAIALESVDHLVAQRPQIGSKMELENVQSKDTSIGVNGNAALYISVADAMEKDQYVQEDKSENHILSSPSDGVTNLTKPLAAGNLSTEIVKDTAGFWHSGMLMMDGVPTEIQKPASETHANPHCGHSTVISPEEMCMVLNHYDLELPKEDEKNLTIDAFFGSARLWPWHIVYYRRLKKGPISTENYARRVAQNQEFGIVDKYVRSSSGWGELSVVNS